MTCIPDQPPTESPLMKVYRFHPCAGRHTSWPSLAACIWPHATIDGDGQFAAASCGARAVTLYTTVGQARARTYSYDRDGCRPKCHRHHNVIGLDSAVETGKPPKPAATVTGRATTPAAPPGPVCGQPRTNGAPCQRPPGWGADPGQPYCRDHGGSVAERTAEKERLVEAALTFARLVEKAGTVPLTVEEHAQAEAAAREVLEAGKGRRTSSLTALVGWPFCVPFLEVPGLAARSLRLLDLIAAGGCV